MMIIIRTEALQPSQFASQNRIEERKKLNHKSQEEEENIYIENGCRFVFPMNRTTTDLITSLVDSREYDTRCVQCAVLLQVQWRYPGHGKMNHSNAVLSLRSHT